MRHHPRPIMLVILDGRDTAPKSAEASLRGMQQLLDECGGGRIASIVGRYDAIVCNYANPDMVGHSGRLQAAVQAIECIDQCLGRVERTLLKTGGEMLVTADHGNAEQMLDRGTGQAHTAHTLNPVPLIHVGGREPRLEPKGGALCDVAPTLLELMGLPAPAEMQGRSLLRGFGVEA